MGGRVPRALPIPSLRISRLRLPPPPLPPAPYWDAGAKFCDAIVGECMSSFFQALSHALLFSFLFPSPPLRRTRAKFCDAIVELDEFMGVHAAQRGAFFLGDEPSLAEASSAPALFRMMATVRRRE